MKKKIFLGLGALATAVALVPLFAAFEAHVINVTATIENALLVPVKEINYGTVFPQEELDRFFDVELSQSFIDEDRVDDVDYVIRQKPKCWNGIEENPIFGRVTEDGQGGFRCVDNGFEILPLLCPYLSKHETTTDGTGQENDQGINAFHGDPGNWTLATTLATEVKGHLAKSIQDTLDTWKIDLKVPCFQEQCAQDWDAFVIRSQGDMDDKASPGLFKPNADLEHKLFGCDLWLEVSGISCTGTPTQSTVVSDTTNTVTGEGNAAALSFIHAAWTASIPGATWIWSTDPVQNPEVDETKIFNKQFTVSGTPTNASLDIATDNTYSVKVNGSPVCSSSDENNFQLATQDVCNVTNLVTGSNTIEITVTNKGLPGSTPSTNPAGLLYKLTYTSQVCSE